MTVSRAELETILSNGDFQVIRSQVDNDEVSNNLNYKPQNGAEIIYLEVAGDCNDLIAINILDDVDKALERGEQLIYGTDDGKEIASSVRTKPNGETVVNDGEDYAVLYSELKSGFDTMKEDLNSMIRTWNTFALAYVPAPGTPGTPGFPPTANTASVTAASIDNSKVEKVRL